MDVREIDGASNTSVDNIREINENIKYPPTSSLYKIIIIDEVHMISMNAFNALLKTLEEPPSHAKFIFATTEFHKVPATINSRCQRFNFRTISTIEIIRGMERILEQEGIPSEADALASVAREARGSFRDALSLLDQVIAAGTDRVSMENVVAVLGIAGRESFSHLMRAVFTGDPSEALTVVHSVFAQGYDPEQFYMDLLQYVRDLTVIKAIPGADSLQDMLDAAPTETEEMRALVADVSLGELQTLFAMMLKSEADLKRSLNPWIAMEMLALRMAQAPKVLEIGELLKRMDARGSPSGGQAARVPQKHARPAVAAIASRTAQNDSAPVKSPPPSPQKTWDDFRSAVHAEIADPTLQPLLDQATLLTMAEDVAEICFTKAVFRSTFDEKVLKSGALNELLRRYFPQAHIKTSSAAPSISPVRERTVEPIPDNAGTDWERALRNEALEHSVIKTILHEFQGSTVEEIKIISKS